MTRTITIEKPKTISKYINMVGVELEGAWTRFGRSPGNGCDHECDDDECQERNCDHSCESRRECWEHECDCVPPDDDGDFTCPDEGLTRVAYRVDSPCWVENCSHECDGDCYVCRHSCEDDCGKPKIPGYHGDGSVSVSTDGIGFDGEIASEPFTNLKDFMSYVESYHPDKVNSSCGTHFHVSVNKDLHYKKLMHPAFYGYFIEKVNAWSRDTGMYRYKQFKARLEGKNQYCCKNDTLECCHGYDAHNPKKQANARGKDSVRYAHINYCRIYKGTIEFRLFHGMKTPKRILSALMCIINSIDSFLAMSPAQISKLGTVKRGEYTFLRNGYDEMSYWKARLKVGFELQSCESLIDKVKRDARNGYGHNEDSKRNVAQLEYLKEQIEQDIQSGKLKKPSKVPLANPYGGDIATEIHSVLQLQGTINWYDLLLAGHDINDLISYLDDAYFKGIIDYSQRADHGRSLGIQADHYSTRNRQYRLNQARVWTGEIGTQEIEPIQIPLRPARRARFTMSDFITNMEAGQVMTVRQDTPRWTMPDELDNNDI